MVEILDKALFLKEFEKAHQYVDDIISGKKTMLEVLENPLDPQEMASLYARATNALKVEDYAGAETLFSGILMLNNKDTRAVMGLGAALEGQGKYEFAVPVYFLVLAITPYDPVAPFRVGICLMNLGKTEDALKMFELAAACRDEIKNPAKKIYVDRAAGMIQALSRVTAKSDTRTSGGAQ